MNKDIVKLQIPKEPSYISLVRLTASGIAYSMALNIDEIEDIKVSIGEACINSLNFSEEDEISLTFIIDEEKLSITVSGVKENIPEELDEKRERELGLLIIKSLMDEVVFNEKGIEMIKYIEDDIQ
ncbi:MAG: histidine kinase [Tissierellia bacterium]|nr:histidine kinase [Tissierellia bacterium]